MTFVFIVIAICVSACFCLTLFLSQFCVHMKCMFCADLAGVVVVVTTTTHIPTMVPPYHLLVRTATVTHTPLLLITTHNQQAMKHPQNTTMNTTMYTHLPV
eukprot:GHVS01091985.1.p1 GENE.GHVS01091985.1~~GHVS01091985.1.p1  ORF type:complete len:101 (+),score=17.43 GHVS01091985.1:138-440(+)